MFIGTHHTNQIGTGSSLRLACCWLQRYPSASQRIAPTFIHYIKLNIVKILKYTSGSGCAHRIKGLGLGRGIRSKPKSCIMKNKRDLCKSFLNNKMRISSEMNELLIEKKLTTLHYTIAKWVKIDIIPYSSWAAETVPGLCRPCRIPWRTISCPGPRRCRPDHPPPSLPWARQQNSCASVR